ncbi:hypothetical protein [Polyangium jinanense]|uniref:TonB C-terminal domain-containing protein n=1 Tax=Polyangium jinanense TaxID=2829994 RepID=A0A9X4AUF9_9BACT|nr:hypothetical protein [Polyangium jinanense]MDC3955853.1 hypothetical protein [Polyangium jinanense]MDC3983212.1 hypothetical protein [Polyangium jinanense]
MVRREQNGGFVLTALLCASLVACTSEPAPAPAPPPRAASSVFSPEVAARLPLAEPEEGGAPVAKAPVRGVLEEILAAAPKSSATPTGPDGGTRVGTETGVRDETEGAPEGPRVGLEASAPRMAKRIQIQEGSPDVHEGIPSPAVERAARAQLYYPLVTRCRGDDGKILPPDTIVLRFKIDVDGYIVPSSISASGTEARYEAAANCMQRELSAAAFRAPAAARGVATWVNATVPSVD